ncbi:MAG: UTP--glucose-1-phosphate uridylyltransferase [Clostridiales bacterium]|nr:UTP--glucose-1-phosphate uridylyltransferase [Clostridiales bacterium]
MKEIEKLLQAHGQQHLISVLEGLDKEQQNKLIAQIKSIDWNTVELWKNPEDLSGKGRVQPIDGLSLMDIEARKEEFRKIGVQAIQDGKVGAVLLAGGQGTRLGSDAPKGAYNIGLTRELYIFEQLICNLLEVCKQCNAFVPLFVMTSDKNDGDTRKFLEEHGFFGYPREFVRFFVQEMAPSVDFDGKLLLEDKAQLVLSPNGNGGWYSSIAKAGVLDDFLKLEWLNVFAVDNVLQRIADPVFVGATVGSGLNCGAKVVRKNNPYEKVGVLCLEDNMPSVIEYYELTDEMANQMGADGNLAYSFGVILNYLFSLSKLRETVGKRIPIHVVKKKIPHLDGTGALVKPETENGYKFETLILDMVRVMESCLPFEVVREREFAPIKNKTGVDSVESARALLQQNGVKL